MLLFEELSRRYRASERVRERASAARDLKLCLLLRFICPEKVKAAHVSSYV